jgi:hypothetical protein
MNANTPQVTFHPTLSGDYNFTMTVTDAGGTPHSCNFLVHVKGPGLRVELCWDTTGFLGADIDLHVHKPGTTTPWFTTTLNGDTNNINLDDCYYYDCQGDTSGAMRPNWGYAQSPLSECVGGPFGIFWTGLGGCPNPRMDIDNISTPGQPENTNVDKPINGQTYRVMVHYFGGGVPTHPMINVYCGGHLLGTYGAAPDLVQGFNQGGDFGMGPMWRVVDVTPQVDGSGNTTGCNLTALHPPGTSSGYFITNNDRSY